MKCSDYIAELLVKNGVTDVFTVVGGGAMHLNDSLGNHPGLHCLYNHHEQACAMAAESYSRLDDRIAVACVTTGPGGTNAVTGVLCAWQDNIPMLVLSGQVRLETTVGSTGLHLRQFGEQEHYIVDTVRSMTKYAVTIKDVRDVRFCIEQALYEAMHGRRGPCWVDVPLDIQGAQLDPDTQRGFIPPEPKPLPDMSRAFELLAKATRPVILAGSAIRTAGVYKQFRAMAARMGVPVVAATAIADLMPVGDENYYGNFGIIGGRAGNFIVQNADCLLALGCRLSFKQIGFNYKAFSPDSIKIVVDVDSDELRKQTIHIDCPVNADLADFFAELERHGVTCGTMSPEWLRYCREVRERFPIYRTQMAESACVNPYYFAKKLDSLLGGDDVVIVGNSCACDNVRQCGVSHEGQRLWGNTNCGTMGYDLPAAIGAAVAAKRRVVCVTGDGSLQMNIQELQTVVHNALPVKLIIHSNGGYNAIVQTHTNYFGRLSGCTKDSGISFPDFEKLAWAYGIPYCRCADHEQLDRTFGGFLDAPGFGICEIISDASQQIEPKSKSRVLPDGQIVSTTIDDLYPFLDKDVYERYASFAHYLESTNGERA